jgi:hypothetical protein
MTDAELLAEIEATPAARRSPQIVEIPGVGEVEFPAGMSAAQIAGAAKRLHAQAKGGEFDPDAYLADTSGASAGRKPGELLRALTSKRIAPFSGGTPQPPAEGAEKERVLSQALNVPVGMLTDDPATNRRIAENVWARGGTRALTRGDALRVGAVTAGLGLSPVAGVPAAVASGALLSGGMSPGQTAGEVIKDAAVGGVATGALAKLVPWAFGALARKAGGKLAAATEKAGEMAQKAKEKERGSLLGTYRSARADESRAVEVLLRAEQTGALTAGQAAQLAALKESPAWTETIRSVTQNYMDDLPGMAAKTAQTKDAFRALSSSMPEAVAAEQARILSGGMAKEQINARLKRYGPMGVAGALAGHTVGGPFGAVLGGASGAAVRPMIHALRRAASHPAVQNAVWSPAASAASAAARQTLTPEAEALILALRGGQSRADPEAQAEAELARLLKQ